VIDAGANIGFFTLLMSKLVGPTGTVLSIEPGANNLEALRRNIALNDCQNVALVDRALWSSNGNQGMFLYDDGGYNSFWPESDKDVLTMVQTTTLDMLCEHYFPSFMKMDIEGAEYEAMLGAKTLLSNDHFPIICEVNTDALKRAGHTAEDLLDLFRQELYDCYVLHESGQLPSSVPDGIAIVPVKQNANVLFAETNHLRRGWEEVKI
jgi:FkbM family methyltransferase